MSLPNVGVTAWSLGAPDNGTPAVGIYDRHAAVALQCGCFGGTDEYPTALFFNSFGHLSNNSTWSVNWTRALGLLSHLAQDLGCGPGLDEGLVVAHGDIHDGAVGVTGDAWPEVDHPAIVFGAQESVAVGAADRTAPDVA